MTLLVQDQKVTKIEMALSFLDTLGTISLSVDDSAEVERFLLNIEELIKTVKLTESELSFVLSKIINHFIPVLIQGIKSPEFDQELLMRALSFFSEHLAEFSLEYLEQFCILGQKCYKISPTNKIKVGGLQLVQLVIAKKPDYDFDAGGFAKHLIRELTATTKCNPTLTKEIYTCLGCLCAAYPDKMQGYGTQIKTYLMNTIDRQTKSSSGSTVDATILEGCFKGLDHFLAAYKFNNDHAGRRKLYDTLVKSCIHPNQKERRMYRRAAVYLFAHHCVIWEKSILEDCKHWYITIKDWTNSFNSEVIYRQAFFNKLIK